MKTLRILAITMLASFALVAQTTQTVNLAVTMSAPVLADIHQHWLDQTIQQMGTITGALDDSTASVSIAVSQATLSQAAPAYKVGDAALIGTEPCTVTAVSGDAGSQTITCTRNEYPLSPMAAHDAGTPIYLMHYPTPWEMLVAESLRPYAIQITQALGARSATFGASITGALAAQ
jgi:hypothetical protein